MNGSRRWASTRDTMTQGSDGYPKLIDLQMFNQRTGRMETVRNYKVYSAGDEALVRSWYEDMNRRTRRETGRSGNQGQRV